MGYAETTAKEAAERHGVDGGIAERLFPEHKAGLSLSHNEHRNYYQTAAAWIEEQELHGVCLEWVSPEQRHKAIETDSVWVLHWYPNTPVGFNALAAADLDVLLEAAAK